MGRAASLPLSKGCARTYRYAPGGWERGLLVFWKSEPSRSLCETTGELPWMLPFPDSVPAFSLLAVVALGAV